ncbi:hypothetical protein [Planctomicrobium sp. SH527]|uniref:hypothetical protein n=1 Tax=Planctomicrobium sp. SH527 TaxID=3448123 RepID=UPI003F5C547D
MSVGIDFKLCWGNTFLSGTCLLLSLLYSGCGLTNPSGDQTAKRLEQMDYTLENLSEEVAGRLKESKRRSAGKSPKREQPIKPAAGEEDRSNGPGGEPFSIDQIASDVATKILRIKDLTLEEALDKLATQLIDQGVPSAEVQQLVAAVNTHPPFAKP